MFGVQTMKTKLYRSTFNQHSARRLVGILIVGLLTFSNLAVFAQSAHDAQTTPASAKEPTSAPTQEAADVPKIPNDQLDSLVSPIALYPDPLLSQVLVAASGVVGAEWNARTRPATKIAEVAKETV